MGLKIASTAAYALSTIVLSPAIQGMDANNMQALYDFNDGATAGFTATIAGSTMTVTAVDPGAPPLVVGMMVTAAGVTAETTISGLGTATGGTGTYTLSTSNTVASPTAMRADAPYTGTSGAITDRSGNNNHATILTGSKIWRTKYGVKTGDVANRGFAAKTNLATGSGTIVMVVRNKFTSSDNFKANLLFSSSNCLGGGANNTTESLGNSNKSTYGLLRVAFPLQSSDANIGFQCVKTDGATAWTGAATPYVGVVAAGASYNSWMAMAVTLNGQNGTVIMRFNGQTLTFTDLTSFNAWIAGSSDFYLFGVASYNSASSSDASAFGDMALCAFYSDVRSVSGLDALIAQAKAKCAALPGFAGVTIV